MFSILFNVLNDRGPVFPPPDLDIPWGPRPKYATDEKLHDIMMPSMYTTVPHMGS